MRRDTESEHLEPDVSWPTPEKMIDLAHSKLRVIVINLAHRRDRREQAMLELKKIFSLPTDLFFLEAEYKPQNPAMGCAISHCNALMSFLADESNELLLVLEDDFCIPDTTAFYKVTTNALLNRAHWDVVVLGHNQAVPIASLGNTGLFQVVNAQTTVGYLLTKRYVPLLLACFSEAALLLERAGDLTDPIKGFYRSCCALDIYWKHQQLKHKFFAPIPPVVIQRASFSDIEGKFIDYNDV